MQKKLLHDLLLRLKLTTQAMLAKQQNSITIFGRRCQHKPNGFRQSRSISPVTQWL